MNIIFDIIPSAIENFSILLFLYKYLQPKKNISGIVHKLILGIGVLVLYQLCKWGSDNPVIEVIYILAAIVYCIIYARIFTRGTLINCIFASLIPFVILSMVNSLTLYTFSTLTNSMLTTLINEIDTTRVLILVVSKGGFILALSLIYRLNPRSEFLFKKNEVIAIIAIFLSSLLVALYILTTQLEIEVRNHKGSTIYFISAIFGLLIINIFTYVSYLAIEKENKERIEYELIKLQLEQQKQTYQEFEKKEIEIRKIRHDMKNYMQACSALLESKEYDKAKEYIDTICQNESKPINYTIITQSLLINALLNNKLHECEEHQIVVDYKILSDFRDLSEIDMCILLGNLWNNAIEATKTLEGERKIVFEVFSKKNYIFIILRNTIAKSILSSNPSFKTTKKDNKNHGFGIVSIKNIIEKYDGMMEVIEKNNYIEFQLSLNFQKK